jgi:hypothetical protein
MAGLPGTGLGGLFYALLTVFVAVREGYLTYCQRSNAARRSLALRMFVFVVLIAGVFGLEGYLVTRVIKSFNEGFASSQISERHEYGAIPTQVTGPAGESAPVPVLQPQPDTRPEPMFQPAFDPVPEAIIPALALTPFIFLAIVLGAVQVLRFFVLRRA